MKRLLAILLWTWTLPVVGVCAEPSPPPPLTRPLVTVRFFIDLECPYSRQAWPIYTHAIQDLPAVALVIQHVPLSRHPLALPAAVAAVAARAQGKEVQFVSALMQQSSPDAAALERAAQIVGLDIPSFAKSQRDPAVLAQVQREQQAGLAFGIRSTPSALVNGRGLSGVPPVEALQRVMQVAIGLARRDLADAGALADLERIGLLRHAPEFVAALDALREGRALQTADVKVAPRGCLGPRWRVTLGEPELSFGPDSPLTLVLFLDPTSPWQLHELAALLALQAAEAKAGRSDVRVVAKLLLHESRRNWRAGSPPLALWLAAAALTLPQKASALLAKIVTNVASAQNVEPVAAEVGLEPAALKRVADAPATTAWLQQSAEMARRADAAPGSIYVNGRKWLGHATDDGLAPALNELRAECKALSGKNAASYATLVGSGRYLRDAELDLVAPEAVGELPGIATLGTSGQKVLLFVDFRSPHSRAAFYMLRRLVTSKDLPIRLTLVSIASGPEPGVTASGAAIIAASRMGKGMEMAELLFSVAKPDDWATLNAGLKKWKLDQATFQKAVESPETLASMRLVWKTKQRLDMRDEPVIYIGDRLYQGPLDEARLERAVRFVRDEPATPAATDCPQP